MIERFAVQAEDVAGIATRVRELVPEAASVHDIVAGIIASVREGGHPALIAHERRFGGGTVPLRVPDDELRAALAALDPEVRAGLELARANVARVAARLARARLRRRARAGAPRPPARAARAPRGHLRPGRPLSLPVLGRDGRRDRAGGRRRARSPWPRPRTT